MYLGSQLSLLYLAGLDPDKDHILELAILISDGELSGPHLEVHILFCQILRKVLVLEKL